MEIPETITVNGREVVIETTSLISMVGAYDTVQDIIYLNKKLVECPKLLDFVLSHEAQHAKAGDKILMNSWVDIKDILTRKMETRRLMRTFNPKRKYWRAVLSNLIIWFVIGTGTVAVLFTITEFLP